MTTKQWGIMGFLMGQKLRDMRQPTEKEPIAYLYNGVQLPPLPEWDKTTYPYVAIDRSGTESSGYTIFLRCAASPTTATALSYLFHAPFCTYAIENGEWVYKSLSNSNYGALKTSHKLLWANHDIYNGDTLVLAASDPIPVYE